MVAAANLVEVAALVGDTARARMLNALMGGQSLTATELAYCANVSRSTASDHLSKLVAARLLTVIRERRFSYYRIASPLVSTGASVGITSRDSSELGFWIVYWSSDGSNVCRAAVHSNSPRLEGRACPKSSRSRSTTRVC